MRDTNEKRRLLTSLEMHYAGQLSIISSGADELSMLKPLVGGFGRVFAPTFLRMAGASPALQRAKGVLHLAESISDLEFSIKTHDLFKKSFSHWLKVHIVLSCVFYGTLLLHVGGEIYFGVRWFQ